MFDQDNTTEGNEALRQRVVTLRDTERRQGIFEDNYNEATGAPSRSDMAPPPMDPDQVPLTAQQLREMGYNPYTEPGVNMPDGSKAEGPQQLMNEREAAAYNVRTPNGPGWYNPSGRDKAMMARGYVPVMNQDGTVSYRLGPGGEVDGLPGTPGRGGRREDLEAQMLKADGTPMVDGQGNAIPRFRVANMSGPLSENNSVYVQSNEAKAKQAAYMKERQLYRDAEIQGVSPAALMAANPGDYGDLTAGGQRDRVAARAANEGARQAAADKREAAWRSQMMLAGRNPAKNAVNAYNALNDPNTNDWQRAVMANALRPDMDNTTPLTVDAMGAQNALRFLNSTNLGAAGLGGTNALMQAQADQLARDKAVARADALIAKYPKGWDGMYKAADVKAVRDAVELQHPGMGDAATAHIRARPAAQPSSGPPSPPPAPGPMNGLPPIGR
jgi:hypothetical protein